MGLKKIQKREEVIGYLHSIKKLFTPDKKLINSNIILFDFYFYAICYHIIINNSEISETRKLNIIKMSINAILDEDNITIDRFEEELKSQLEKYHKKKNHHFFIIFPTNLTNQKKDIPSIELHGQKINLIDGEEMNNIFNFHDHDDYKYPPEIFKNVKKNHLCFQIDAYAQDIEAFVHKSNELFQDLRSIINYISSYRKITLTHPRSKSISLIDEPKYGYIFDENKTYLQYIYGLEQDKKVEKNLSPNTIYQIPKIINKIDNIKNENLRMKIILALRLHSSALDNYGNYPISFLHFWQIIEMLTILDGSENNTVISSRLLPFCGDIVPYKDIFEHFRKKRNSLIHNGDLNIFSEIDLILIKELVDHFLGNLLMNIDKFKSPDNLKTYYKCCDFFLNDLKNFSDSNQDLINDKIKFLIHINQSSFCKNI